MDYLYQVNFDKVFVAGLLKGRRYTNGYLRFTTWQDAEAFRVSCDGKTVASDATGAGKFIREDAILTALEGGAK